MLLDPQWWREATRLAPTMNWLRVILATVAGVMTAIVLLFGIMFAGWALVVWLFGAQTALFWYVTATLTLPLLVPMSLAAGTLAGAFLHKKMRPTGLDQVARLP
jgi:hypothetical protein